jgi:hypothetical protein
MTGPGERRELKREEHHGEEAEAGITRWSEGERLHF